MCVRAAGFVVHQLIAIRDPHFPFAPFPFNIVETRHMEKLEAMEIALWVLAALAMPRSDSDPASHHYWE